jgi:hypothetical protein
MSIYHCLKCEEIGVFVMTWATSKGTGGAFGVGDSVSAKSLKLRCHSVKVFFLFYFYFCHDKKGN